METHIVIMAGGIGSRLWPISTPEMPKQFIDVLGTGRSLIQSTVGRFSSLASPENMWVVTSEKYVDTVHEQLPMIPVEQILAEPEARNTAPCIAYACWKIARRHPDVNVVVTPADAYVKDTATFAQLIQKASEATASTEKIVTIGVAPTRPDTGYGYICSTGVEHGRVVKVSEFKEKPDKETARKYMDAGNYFWNAGIFVWNVRTVISELWKHAPEIAAIMDQLAVSLYTDFERVALKELFPQCPRISIDYAVMEKSAAIHVIAGEFGWSDLGTWGAVMQHVDRDAAGNAVVGTRVRMFDSSNCMVHTDGSVMAVVEGLDGYIVSVRNGNMLVCRMEDEQNIREYSRK